MTDDTKQTPIGDDLKDSARRVWLAGLGALAAAEEEGSKLFRNLVEKGEQLERRGQGEVDRVRGSVEGARGRAEGALGDLERRIEARIETVVQRLGVPSRAEVAELTRKVEELTRSVDRLNEQKK